MRLMCGFPFAPIQILTGDTRKACSSRHGWLHDAGRSFQRKSRIERRFESRSQDGVDSLKHGRLAHVRSQFSLFRRSPTHKNLPPATFCTSEHVLFGYFLHDAKSDKPFSLSGAPRFSKPRFSSPQLRFRTNKIKTFPKGASRFCKPRSSSPQRRFRIDKIKSFAAPRPFRRPWRHPFGG